jgi:DNA-3-methyladenine glycosylase I
MQRCAWAKGDILAKYHDEEWGQPLHNEQLLFELLMLEGMQAGLSWEIILKKRDAYRKAFDGFDPEKIAKYSQHKVESLLENEGIVRNRLKVEAIIQNARAYLDFPLPFGPFVWSFVDGAPQINRWRTAAEVPCKSGTSEALSTALSANGFKFVGTKICYSFMQASGMICDHTLDCACHPHSLTHV